MKYKLQELLTKYQITNIDFSSKNIKPGSAFVAVKGTNCDGNQYIFEALQRGAKLVFTDSKLYAKAANLPIIYVKSTRQLLNTAAKLLYPQLPANLIAVTGTNGKTSVVAYCQQLFSLQNTPSAFIGTTGVHCSKTAITEYFASKQHSLTTSDIVTFRYVLNKLAIDGVNHVAFEASSHGLDQQRLGDIKVKVAAFTSFSVDHLDYHKTTSNYLQAKLKLFSKHLTKGGLAIVNANMPCGADVRAYLKVRNINYLTVGTDGDLAVKSVAQSIFGQKVIVNYLGITYNFNTEIIGSFQANNLLIAALATVQFGFSFADIINSLPQLKAVSGRLERVTSTGDLYHVFVDYAHTPDALEQSLRELKQIKPATGRLLLVFGCGGNRDAGKRPLMGKIACQLADIVIVTDDNSRFEEPAAIRKQILLAAPGALEVGDRKVAITTAINMLQNGDILLIAGKGHERYQIIADVKMPFNDIQIAKEALRAYR